MSPIFGYTCKECGISFEEWCPVSGRDEPVYSDCPNCGKRGVERHVGNAGFHLKGGGWADDGYSKTVGNILKHKKHIRGED